MTTVPDTCVQRTMSVPETFVQRTMTVPDTFVVMEEHEFISNSRLILAGDIQAKGLASTLRRGMSFMEIESVLTQLAEEGNSDSPVAARLQLHPGTVSRLTKGKSSM